MPIGQRMRFRIGVIPPRQRLTKVGRDLALLFHLLRRHARDFHHSLDQPRHGQHRRLQKRSVHRFAHECCHRQIRADGDGVEGHGRIPCAQPVIRGSNIGHRRPRNKRLPSALPFSMIGQIDREHVNSIWSQNRRKSRRFLLASAFSMDKQACARRFCTCIVQYRWDMPKLYFLHENSFFRFVCCITQYIANGWICQERSGADN